MGKVLTHEHFSVQSRQSMIAVIDAHHSGRMETHSHSFYEMVYVQSGFTLQSCQGQIRMLSTGDLFFIRPGEEHSYINAYRFNICNCIFCKEALGSDWEALAALPGLSHLFTDCPEETLLWSDANRILHVDVSQRRAVETAIENIRSECEEKQIGWECSVKAGLVSLLVQYARLYQIQCGQQKITSSDYYGYIFKVLQYVHENYMTDITMADLSRVTGLSADYMARRFKAVMYMSPSEYVRRFRIAKSMELLASTDLSIAEIAVRTGFSDISLFSRVFKSAVGIPPASYRKNMPGERIHSRYNTSTLF